MLPSDSPFPGHWYGIALDNAGLRAVRPDVGTYGQYSFEELPPIPFRLKGDFAWLTAPDSQFCAIADENDSHAQMWWLVQRRVLRQGLRLPDPFVRFFGDPALPPRVRSCTGCYVDLSEEAVPSPLGRGHLLRFLSDPEDRLFWYLYLSADGSDHAVVCSSDVYGTADEEENRREAPPDPARLAFCAESFEIFIARFWLENEIWIRTEERRGQLPAGGQAYLDSYLGRAG
jgi:hypothetical protein